MSWRDWFRRRAARVVLVDGRGRVLLFRAAGAGSAGDFWYLPGGGIFPREPVERAAARELREETGITDAVVGPVLGERRDVEFRWRGRRMVQDEWYVAGRVAHAPVAGRGSDHRAAADHRWWSLEELREAGGPVVPPDVVALVETVIALGSPSGPD